MADTPVFRIFGVGGAGVRIADAVAGRTGGRLAAVGIETDVAALENLTFLGRTLVLGENRFHGGGSACDPAAVRMSAEESRAAISRLLDGTSVAVAVAGIGRGTGAGALPVLLRLADERRIPVLALLLSPFAIEGAERVRAASTAMRSLEGLGTARILLSNDDLAPATQDLTLQAAFDRATDTAASALTLLWKMSALHGYINVSTADAMQMLRNGRGTVDFGRAVATGPRRFSEATDALWNQPGLGLANKASGAKAALVCVLGGPDLRLQEAGDAVAAVSAMLPFGTPVSLSTVVDPAAAGRLEIVVLLFRRWAPAEADEAADAAGTGRFSAAAPTTEGGENLDVPTYLRRRIHINID